MDYIKKHINGILGTILFHLVIIIFALLLSINSMQRDNESYLIISPEYFEDLEKEIQELDKINNKEFDNFEVERYISEIHNLRQNNKHSQTSENEGMSQEDLKRMYEEEFLKEKHGENYEKIINSTYHDYLNKDEISDLDQPPPIKKSNQVISESGIVLVEYRLDNDSREAVDLYVPSYKCEGGGKVVVKVSLRHDGSVKSASISSKSDGAETNECILNTAKAAALRSKFTSSTSTASEYGEITYIFVSQ